MGSTALSLCVFFLDLGVVVFCSCLIIYYIILTYCNFLIHMYSNHE